MAFHLPWDHSDRHEIDRRHMEEYEPFGQRSEEDVRTCIYAVAVALFSHCPFAHTICAHRHDTPIGCTHPAIVCDKPCEPEYRFIPTSVCLSCGYFRAYRHVPT